MAYRLIIVLINGALLWATTTLSAQESVTLAWDPSVDASVTGYRIHYGTSSGLYDQNLDVGEVTTASVGDLEIGTTYFFVVTAYNAEGLESGPSNEVSATSGATAPEAPDSPNDPPIVGLTDPADGAVFTAPAKVTLTAEASDPDGSIARVEFHSDSGKLGEATTSPFTFSWNPAVGSHRVWARAYDDTDASADSAAITLNVEEPLPAPSALAASPAVEEVELDWTDNSLAEEGFIVECRAGDASSWIVIANVPTNTTSFIDSGRTPGRTYSYRVKAYDSKRESAYSNEAAATPGAPPTTFRQTASSETAMAGTLTGNLDNLLTDDGIFESITEIASGGRPSSRFSYLEHLWTFDLVKGGLSRVIAKAHMSESWDGDVFEFDYSIDAGSTWTPLFTISSRDADNVESGIVPSTGGPLLLRVRDSDRTAGNLSLDTLHIDHLYVHTDTAEATVPEAPISLMAEAKGNPHQVVLSWSDQSHNELGFEVERRVVGGAWLSLRNASSNSVSYADGDVSGATAYEYRIRAFNEAGVSSYSNLASVVTPESISLSASSSKVRGHLVVTLEWSAPDSEQIDIYRDGYKIATVPNSGSYVDETGMRMDVLVTYWVCRTGTDICSNAIVIQNNNVLVSSAGEDSSSESQDGSSPTTKYTVSGQMTAETWRSFHFSSEDLANDAIGDWQADPDGDGLTNLTEMAIGSDPWLPGVENLPAVTAVDLNGSSYPQLFFARRSTAPIQYVVQTSPDGTTWESGEDVITVVTDTPQLLIVRGKVPVSRVAEYYMRLTFVLPD